MPDTTRTDAVRENPLPALSTDGDLITYEDGGVTRCLGYLMDGLGHGVWDAELGRVPVTPEAAARHNAAFDGALVEGLDETCQVGQGQTFYVKGNEVRTWTGTVLGEAHRLRSNGLTVTLVRGSRTFRGTLKRSTSESAFFVRIA